MHILIHSLTHSPTITLAFIHTLTHSLTYNNSGIHAHTHSLTHSLTYNNSGIHSYTHSLTHSLTHPPTITLAFIHTLTHSPTITLAFMHILQVIPIPDSPTFFIRLLNFDVLYGIFYVSAQAVYIKTTGNVNFSGTIRYNKSVLYEYTAQCKQNSISTYEHMLKKKKF